MASFTISIIFHFFLCMKLHFGVISLLCFGFFPYPLTVPLLSVLQIMFHAIVFKKILFLREVLWSQKNWEGSIEISYILLVPHMHSLPIIYIPHQSDTFVTTFPLISMYDEHTLPHLGFTLGVVHFMTWINV